MRSFTVARVAVAPLFGLMLAACSLGGDDQDLALEHENVSGAEKGDAPSQGGSKVMPTPGEGDAGQATGGALPESKDIEPPLPDDLGKGEDTSADTPAELPSKGPGFHPILPPKSRYFGPDLPSKGGDFGSNLPSKGGNFVPNLPARGERVLSFACPKARDQEVVGACVQVITYAKNPATGECCVYATPCDVPKRWEISGSADAVCN